MTHESQSQPELSQARHKERYLEFIVLAALAVVGSVVIAVFVADPAKTPPIAGANCVAVERDAPESVAVAEVERNGDQPTQNMEAVAEHGRPNGPTPDQMSQAETNVHGRDNSSSKVDDEAKSAVATAAAKVEPVADTLALKTYSVVVSAINGSVTRSPDQTSYNHGQTVTLEAVPNTGYRFSNWTGDLSDSTNPTTLVMEEDKSVAANFILRTYGLTATAVDGSVAKSPDKPSYNHGEAVTLEAVPHEGYRFTTWMGDLSGNTNPVTLVMQAEKSVTAAFALKTYTLKVTADDGSVTRSPDQVDYNHGQAVTLEALPDTGYRFMHWTGGLSGSTNPVTLVMDADKSVTAAFALKTYTLTVTAGDGFVARSPLRSSYDRGEKVTLKAVPNAGYSFANWAGDISGATNPATLVMDADKSVTASFALTAKASDVMINAIGMKLVYVPAGSFMMGSGQPATQLAEEYGEGQGRFESEFPQHPVRVSKGFWMGRTEVTQGQYTTVMNAQPWSGKAYVQENADSPAVYVSWDDAVEFCRKLSQLEGITYRLPTEAEWEYACRAGTTTRFSFGDSDLPIGGYAWFNGNADQVGQDYAHRVGQKKSNPWGLYDMHGNVFEWCSDYYDEKYYVDSPTVDPNGSSFGSSHSVRGGSWDNGPSYSRSSYRSHYPVSRGLLVGFRVVSDGQAISDMAAVPIEVESARDRQTDNDVGVRTQEEVPVAVKVQEEAPVVAAAQEVSPVAAKTPAQGTTPDGNKPVAAGTAQEISASVAIDTDNALVYASGNVEDILDRAAVDARSGRPDQARTALTSLLDNEDAMILAAYELGLIHYEHGDVDQAIPVFQDALTAAFPGPVSGKDEQALTALLNQEADAARIRYELGLIYQSQSKQDQAARLLRDALSVISAKGATYIGVKKCKSCHFKQWNSWRKTKMAAAFELLTPGVRSDEKTRLKFDPNKDYTKDPTCLSCHTSGFGMPGGYVIPTDGDAEAKEQAADNVGVTCEGCHGPGSRSVGIQEDIKENKRPYTFAELRAVGFHKAGVRSCTPCHNASDPGKEPGYHFAYEERRKEGQHENIELKYRQE